MMNSAEPPLQKTPVREKTFLSPARDRTFAGAIVSKLGETASSLRHRLGTPQHEPPKPSPSELEEVGLDEEEEEEEEEGSEVIEEKRKQQCPKMINVRWLCVVFKWICPSYTPIFMFSGFLVVIVLLIIRRIRMNSTPPLSGYAAYLGITSAIVIVWLIVRLFWMVFVYRHVLPESRFIIAMNAVLDPHLTYLVATINACLFWACLPISPIIKSFLGLETLMQEGIDDLDVLLKANVLMILWTIRVRSLGILHLLRFNDIIVNN